MSGSFGIFYLLRSWLSLVNNFHYETWILQLYVLHDKHSYKYFCGWSTSFQVIFQNIANPSFLPAPSMLADRMGHESTKTQHWQCVIDEFSHFILWGCFGPDTWSVPAWFCSENYIFTKSRRWMYLSHFLFTSSQIAMEIMITTIEQFTFI